MAKTNQNLYKDFNANFLRHPVTGALATVSDVDAVKQSIRNLIATNRGERLYQPLVGSDIRSLLFENIDAVTVDIAKRLVRESLENYEPRAEVLGVDILEDSDGNGINIKITFSVENSQEPVDLDIALERLK